MARGACPPFFNAQIPTLGWMSGTRGTLRNTGWLLDGTPDPDSKTPYCQPEGKAAGAAAEPMMNHTGDEPEMGMMMGPGPVVEPRVLEEILADYETWEKAAPKAAQRDALRVGGFSSGHPGVVNFLFGDGSVRSLSKLTDASLLQQFGHRADGKLLYESQDE